VRRAGGWSASPYASIVEGLANLTINEDVILGIIIGVLLMISARRKPAKPRKPAELLDNLTDRNVIARDDGFRITGVVASTQDSRAWIFFNGRINDSLNASDLDGLTLEDGAFTRTVSDVSVVEEYFCEINWNVTPSTLGAWDLTADNTTISAAGLPTLLQSGTPIDVTAI